MRNSPAPSIRAASSSSVGTASGAYTQIRYSPNGLTRDGRMTDQGVLVRCRSLNSRKVGTASAVPGTATAPSTTANTRALAGEVVLRQPVPASVARKVAPPAPTTTYSTVFPSQRTKMPLS